MAVVKGIGQTLAMLNKFSPDLRKGIDKEARLFLKVMVRDAKGFAPDTNSVLSGWASSNKGRKITAQSSMFATRSFPLYQASEVKAGIDYKVGGMKTSRNGFRALYAIRNKSAAGAIYETAGRINPQGQPWAGPTASPGNHKVSHSRNPKAGEQFINAMGGRTISGKHDGRLAYRAVEKDRGRAITGITDAVAHAVNLANMAAKLVP